MNKLALFVWLAILVAIAYRLTLGEPDQGPLGAWMREKGIEDQVLATFAGALLFFLAVLARLVVRAARTQKQLDELNVTLARYQRARRG